MAVKRLVSGSNRFLTTTVVGVLILAVVGNFLYETAKPLLLWVGNALVSVSTLGIASLRDSVYVEVAKGSYERAAPALLTFFACLALGPLAFGAGLLTRGFFRKKAAQGGEVEGAGSEKAGRALSSIVAGLAGLLLILVVQAAQINYIVRAARLLEQLQTAVSPYVSEQQRLAFASCAALLRSRQEYVELVDELDTIARENGIEPPDFSIW
jgi:hypothetical protein